MKKIIGTFEKIKVCGLPKVSEFEIHPEILAKIDTGAFSGVIHAGNIVEKNGVLSFDILGDSNNHLETTEFRVRKVRNTHGGVKNRYLVSLRIEINNSSFEALVGLDDRSRMKFKMLLGRAFLNKYEFLVDSCRSIEFDEEWKKMKGEQ